jgi:hypothetical protein
VNVGHAFGLTMSLIRNAPVGELSNISGSLADIDDPPLALHHYVQRDACAIFVIELVVKIIGPPIAVRI